LHVELVAAAQAISKVRSASAKYKATREQLCATREKNVELQERPSPPVLYNQSVNQCFYYNALLHCYFCISLLYLFIYFFKTI